MCGENPFPNKQKTVFYEKYTRNNTPDIANNSPKNNVEILDENIKDRKIILRHFFMQSPILDLSKEAIDYICKKLD